LLVNFINKFQNNQEEVRGFLFVSFLIFCAIFFIRIAEVIIYPLIHRVTYSIYFVSPFQDSQIYYNLPLITLGILLTFSALQNKRKMLWSILPISIVITLYLVYQQTELITGLSILVIVILLIFYHKTSIRKIPPKLSNSILTLMLIYIGLSVLATSRWVSNFFVQTSILEDSTWTLAFIDSNIFYFLALVSPHLLLLIAFSFLIRPFVGNIENTVSFLQEKTNHLNKNMWNVFSLSKKMSFLRYPKTVLTFSIILAAALPLLPWLPTINPDAQTIGTDSYAYQLFLYNLNNATTSSEYFERAFVTIEEGDRPLTIIVMDGISKITGQNYSNTSNFIFPSLLSIFLVISVYYFVRTYRDAGVSAYVALVAALSHHVIIGIYAGFLANWFAICFVVLTMGLVLKMWKADKKIHYFLFFGLLIATLFIHTYTWVYLITIILCFVGISYLRDKEFSMKKFVLTVGIVFAVIALDVIKVLFFNSHGGLEGNYEIFLTQGGLEHFAYRWDNLYYVFSTRLGGFLSNTILLALAFVWAISAKYERAFDRIILASLFVTIIPIIFGDLVIQSRVIYNIPFYIPAALLCADILRNKKYGKFSSWLSVMLILTMLTFALRAINNMYLIFPE